MTKENINTLGVFLAAGLGMILCYWVSYYFWNTPTAPTYSPVDEPTKDWPAEVNHDKG